jgi:hypothetical protein
MKIDDFKNDLTHLINRCSLEGRSNTPDYILSEYLVSCLVAYETASNANKAWHGILEKQGCEI